MWACRRQREATEKRGLTVRPAFFPVQARGGGVERVKRPAGALWFSAAEACSENNQERKRRKEKKGGKEGRAREGGHLIAVQLRRDALIAPSGCGQHRGAGWGLGGVGVQCKESRVNSLPDVFIGPISIRRLNIKYIRVFT